jgi:hypothetical protein
MFWTFNLSFDILATVLATFSSIGQSFAKFSGHTADDAENKLDRINPCKTFQASLTSATLAYYGQTLKLTLP